MVDPLSLPSRENIMGVLVSAVNLDTSAKVLHGWIRDQVPHYVCLRDAHGIVLSQQDEKLRQIHNAAGLVTPDGMPLVWLLRLHGHRDVDRVYGPDLLSEICERSRTEGYRHFFYGGKQGVAERLADSLRARFPGLDIVGTYSPPLRPIGYKEDSHVIEKINQTKPDIVWVGLSTPKQEYWMANHRKILDAPALIGIGAAFDFHSGLIKQAPKWVQRSGFEWLYRLVREPKRLGSRYFKTIPTFLTLALLQTLRLRTFGS